MRLLSAIDTGGDTLTSHYTYDGGGTGDGNITSYTGTSFTYRAGNEIATPTSYTYDGAGEVTANPAPSSLSYNGALTTTSVTPSGGTAVALSYQTQGQDSVATDGATSLENGLLGVQSTTGPAGTTYFEKTPDGQLVSEDITSCGSSTDCGEYYYMTDHQGSVVGLVGTDGTLAASSSYGAYGGRLVITENPDSLTEYTGTTVGAGNPWRFQGGYYDTQTSLYHFGARWYDTITGRWTQPDSVFTLANPQNSNLYVFAGDDPVNNSDPSGHNILGDILGGVLTGVGVVTTGFFGYVAADAIAGLAAEASVGTYLAFGAAFCPLAVAPLALGLGAYYAFSS